MRYLRPRRLRAWSLHALAWLGWFFLGITRRARRGLRLLRPLPWCAWGVRVWCDDVLRPDRRVV